MAFFKFFLFIVNRCQAAFSCACLVHLVFKLNEGLYVLIFVAKWEWLKE